MRSPISRPALAIALSLLLVGCSAAPSTAPITSPSASGTPTPMPTATEPPPVDGLAMGTIAAGREHTCSLTTTGGVRCWGANGSGQLGNRVLTDSNSPVDSDLVGVATAVVAGAFHSCALTEGGTVTCWGTQSNTPGGADLTQLKGVTAISAGEQHTCALTTAGGVKCWGANYTGQLGAPSPDVADFPVDVSGLASDVIAIAGGGSHTCALTSGGGVKCWGDGASGQLGNGTNTESIVPVDVSGLSSGVVAISTGDAHTCALMTGGAVRCWGDNWYGQLGNGSTTASNVPVDVSGLAGDVVAISAGYRQTCVLSSAGAVQCWGNGGHGELGDLSTFGSRVPVVAIGLGTGVAAIDLGGAHLCATYRGGGVRCLGDNYYGQLGVQTDCTSSSLPQEVPVNAGAVLPSPSSEPGGTPGARIDHATGPTDILLRFENIPDHSISDLGGEEFRPGAEFTLYGDGTVIFRNEVAALPPAEGPIVRARPFLTTRLDEDRRSSRSCGSPSMTPGFGARARCTRNAQTSTPSPPRSYVVHAGGLDKHVDAGPRPSVGPAHGLPSQL